MYRLLLAHEIGGGSGHLWPWRQTLLAAAATGWAGTALAGRGAGVLAPQAWAGVAEVMPPPGLPMEPAPGAAPTSWPQLLVGMGYAQNDRVVPALASWTRLLVDNRVSHVIADHAPLALLAAKALGLQVTEAGAGFCVPPAVSPMPGFLPAGGPGPESLQAEASLLGCWNHALQAVGARLFLPTLADAFRGHARHVTSLAELDPYGTRPDVTYTGPQAAAPAQGPPGQAQTWWATQGGETIAYLKLHTPQLKTVLKALQHSGRKTLAVVPGIGVERLAGNLRVTGSPIDLAAVLPAARLFITNGGIHGVGQAIGAGVPVLVIPMQVEQALTAARVAAHGWGRCWDPASDPPSLLALH